MATIAELQDALINADKAGDAQSARVLADAIVAMRQQPQTKPSAPPDEGGRLRVGPFDTGIQTPGWLDRGLAGVGKAMTDVARGAGQLVGAVSRQDVEEARKRDQPLMDTTAGKVGNFVGNVAMLAPTALIPGANTLAGASTIGAVSGLVQPSTSTGETLGNIALGGAGGFAGQAVANRIGQMAASQGSQITQGQRQAAQAGEALGMRLTPGKASGSAMLQKVEAALESNPITSSGFDAIKEGNQRALNRAAARAIGERADELSTPVLARAEARLGQVFDSVADRTPVQLDPMATGARLRQIEANAEGMLMGNAELAQNGLWRRLDDFVNNQGGASREQLRQLSSNLGKAARNNMTNPNGDRALGDALFQAQEVVEDAIQGTLSAAQQRAYNEARNQYRNLLSLTTKTNVTNPSSGNVAGRSLATTLMQKDRGGFTMGGNTSPMYDAARFVQAFPDIVGNSGTATRSMGPADYLAGLPGNIFTRLYLSQPVTAAARGGAGAVNATARLLDNDVTGLLSMPVGVASGLGLAGLLAP
tara:strand:+ start:1031 stop:2635 length:1605 start_codon:yes stop_codon:yes gene_type:complete